MMVQIPTCCDAARRESGPVCSGNGSLNYDGPDRATTGQLRQGCCDRFL